MSFLPSLFIPTQANNHKAFLLHNVSLLCIATFLFGLTLPLRYIPTNNYVLGISTDLTSEQVIERTNQARLEQGASPLTSDPLLELAAQQKLADMFEFNYWDHYSPTQRAPWKFILDQGYSYQYAGENLGRDFHNTEELVVAWLESPGHRANLLDPRYQHIGVAIGQGEIDGQPTILIVQMFATPITQEGAIPVDQLSSENFEAAGVVVNPDLTKPPVYATTRSIALTALALLIIILSLDAIFLHNFKRGTRVSGKYWAHMIFLYAITSILVFSP